MKLMCGCLRTLTTRVFFVSFSTARTGRSPRRVVWGGPSDTPNQNKTTQNTTQRTLHPLYVRRANSRLEKLLKVRETLNEGLPEEEHLSLNDMLLKAAALASQKVPDVSMVTALLFSFLHIRTS